MFNKSLLVAGIAILNSIACANLSAAGSVVISGFGINVTSEDVEKFIELGIPEQQRAQVLSSNGAIKQIAENILATRALAKFSQQVTEVDNSRIEWAGRYQTDEQLKKGLLSLEAEKALASVDWDKMAEELYERDKKSFYTENQVNVSHILVMNKARTDSEALALAKKTLGRVRAGENFADLAKEISDDPSAKQNGGNVGFFGPGKMVPEFEQAAFAMTDAESVSEPVKTQFGYHVIKYHSRQDGHLQPFAEVKHAIIPELKRQTIAKFKSDRLQALATSKEVSVNAETIKKIQQSYLPK